jgi:hypothetical protein
MKNNYISFGLWGNKKAFTSGMVRNATLAKRIYTGWKVIVYHDRTVPADVLSVLEDLDVKLVDMTGSHIYPRLWKFLAADLPDAGYTIFRDADSSFSVKEKYELHDKMSHTYGDDEDVREFPSKSSSKRVMSFICSLMVPVVELKRFIGGF